MKQPILSIAAICYNNAASINQWVDSIVNQILTFPVEVVVTDDCSTDDSLAVLEAARERFEEAGIDFIVQQNEENLGVGQTRFNSISRCRGKYVIFLDGDDCFIGTASLNQIVRSAMREDADCVIFGARGNSTSAGSCLRRRGVAKTYNPQEAVEDVFNWRISVTVWDKLFKREIVADRNITNLRINEDMICTPMWLWNCDYILQIPVFAYRYNRVEGSITHKCITDMAVYESHVAACQQIKDELKEFFSDKDTHLAEMVDRFVNQCQTPLERVEVKEEDDVEEKEETTTNSIEEDESGE